MAAVIMKHSIRMIFATAVIIFGAMDAMAIEEANYTVLKKDNHFEIRDYAPSHSCRNHRGRRS